MIAVIDYGVGNLFSVEKALLALGADVRVTNEEGVLRQAQKYRRLLSDANLAAAHGPGAG